jgi:hypothetical protein
LRSAPGELTFAVGHSDDAIRDLAVLDLGQWLSAFLSEISSPGALAISSWIVQQAVGSGPSGRSSLPVGRDCRASPIRIQK